MLVSLLAALHGTRQDSLMISPHMSPETLFQRKSFPTLLAREPLLLLASNLFYIIFFHHFRLESRVGSALKMTSSGWKTSLCPFSQMGQWNSVLFWVHKHPFTVSANSLTAFPRAPARAMHVRKVSMSLSASHCCFLNCEFQRARGWPPIALVRGCRNGTSCVKIFLLVELSQPRSSVVRASARKAEDPGFNSRAGHTLFA